MDEYLENKINYIHDYLEKNQIYTIVNYSQYGLNVSLHKKSDKIYNINIWWHQSCCIFYKVFEDKEVTSIKEALQLLYNLTDDEGKFLYFSKFHTKIFLSEEEKNIYEIDNNVKLNYYLNKKEIPTCCVCLEDTLMRTVCDHSLCLDCNSKIMNHCPYLCPYCRKNLDIDEEEEDM
jgi:hypothetical protein